MLSSIGHLFTPQMPTPNMAMQNIKEISKVILTPAEKDFSAQTLTLCFIKYLKKILYFVLQSSDFIVKYKHFIKSGL